MWPCLTTKHSSYVTGACGVLSCCAADRDGEEERRDVDGHDKGVEYDGRDVCRDAPAAEIECGRGKVVAREDQAEECDEPVLGDGLHTNRQDERSEGDGRRQDGAEEGCRENVDDDDGVTWLAVISWIR